VDPACGCKRQPIGSVSSTAMHPLKPLQSQGHCRLENHTESCIRRAPNALASGFREVRTPSPQLPHTSFFSPIRGGPEGKEGRLEKTAPTSGKNMFPFWHPPGYDGPLGGDQPPWGRQGCRGGGEGRGVA